MNFWDYELQNSVNILIRLCIKRYYLSYDLMVCVSVSLQTLFSFQLEWLTENVTVTYIQILNRECDMPFCFYTPNLGNDTTLCNK